jgi:hypothetical protein
LLANKIITIMQIKCTLSIAKNKYIFSANLATLC